MDISIITVTYNSERVILGCIEALKFSQGCTFEFFLVDNDSHDSTLELIKKNHPDVNLVENRENKGYAAANNQVIQLCKGKYILFLNPDCAVGPDSLRKLALYMDDNPHIGIASPQIVYPDGTLQESIAYSYPRKKFHPVDFPKMKKGICWVLGACMICRADLIMDLGGFDERFFLYGEDQDICFRARAFGYEIGLCTDAVVSHVGGDSEIHTDASRIWKKKIIAEYIFFRKYLSEKQIRKIMRRDYAKAWWRVFTLNLHQYVHGKREKTEKIAKYEAILDGVSSVKNQMQAHKIADRYFIPKVSIIVCFYERINYLKHCLDSLQSCAGDFDEVVIADDGSDEEVVCEIRRLSSQYTFPIVHAWHARGKPRRAASRNNGIRHASGDLLIFIDSDFLILPNTIRAHVALSKPGTYCAGRVKYLTEAETESIMRSTITKEVLERMYTLSPEKPIVREHGEFLRYSLLMRFGYCSGKPSFGGHFSAFRKDIEAVNGYDENFVGWGGEDIDLARRMCKAGFAGRSVITTARVLHMWHPKELGNKHWKEGPNIEYFHRKNIDVYCKNGLKKKASDS